MNNVGSVSSPYVYAQTLLAARDSNERDIWDRLIDRDMLAEWTMWEVMGKTISAPSKVFHYDDAMNESKLKVIEVTGSVSGSGTATVTTTLDAANSGYLSVGDIVLMPGASAVKTGRVTSVTGSPNTISITTAIGTGVLTLATGNKLTIIGNAMSEGSTATTAKRFGREFVRNNIQIMDETYSITDVQSQALGSIPVLGTQHLLASTQLDSFTRLMAKVNMTAWFGEANSTTFEETDGSVQTTRGINSYVNTYGTTASTLTPGTVTLADINDLIDSIVAVKGYSEYYMLGSTKSLAPLNDFMMNLGSSGATSVRKIMDGDKLVLNLTEWEKSGIKFWIGQQKILSNPQVANYDDGTGLKEEARSIYLLPYGKCPVYGGGMQEHWQLRISEADPAMAGYTIPPTIPAGVTLSPLAKGIREFRDGGLFGIGTTATGTGRYYLNMGFQGFNANKWLKFVTA